MCLHGQVEHIYAEWRGNRARCNFPRICRILISNYFLFLVNVELPSYSRARRGRIKARISRSAIKRTNYAVCLCVTFARNTAVSQCARRKIVAHGTGASEEHVPYCLLTLTPPMCVKPAIFSLLCFQLETLIKRKEKKKEKYGSARSRCRNARWGGW